MSNDVFLPASREEMEERGWYYCDVLIITGDAYVDHPSFGPAVIGRELESMGFRAAMLAQPDWRSAESFKEFGRPRYAVLISAGNLDSMVAHYTASKKRRSEDFYSPGKRTGLRPDRAVTVYSNRAREAFGDIPIVIGGLEASLRRFAHYDYWDDRVRRCILEDSGADLLVYGMGERAEAEILSRLKRGEPVSALTDIRGTAYMSRTDECAFPAVRCPSYEEVCASKRSYAEAARIQYDEHDPISGRAVVQGHGSRFLIVNPPAMPLGTEELDRVAALPYTRRAHPKYDAVGGVPAVEEVRFSIIHNRGCFGACNFCALAFHQGRIVTSRSHESVLREAEEIAAMPDFKGYIHDVGGPTANFRHPACAKQLKSGLCRNRRCLAPEPCPNLDADHSDYLALLRKLRAVKGVKKVFVRSGVRYDYMLCDRSGEFFSELVNYHVSGQLKVAPEHCVNEVLDCMGKPHIEVYERFMEKYARLNRRYGKEQYVVPYLMSSHPGSTLKSAAELAEYLHRRGMHPEQVQDFYPTPGTLSTCMYYTGLDPRTMKPVYAATSPREKEMQRALLQWSRPEKRELVIKALRAAGRSDLIGWGRGCLIRPARREKPAADKGRERPAARAPKKRKAGWAKPKKKKK